MRKNHFLALFLAVVVACFTACDNKDNPVNEGSIPPAAEDVVEGIVPIKSGIGEWDAAYLTRYGFFTVSKDVNKGDEGKSPYCSVSYMSTDGKEIASLIATKADNLPTQLVIKDKGVVLFSFPNDSIVELVFDDGKNVKFIGSYLFPKSMLPSLDKLINEDVFKSVLANAAALLKANKPSQADIVPAEPVAQGFADVFETVSGQAYTEDDKAVADLPTDATGNYQFSGEMDQWYETGVTETVINTLSIWTGKATYKVGGSSCTLSGTIWCTTDAYNEYGTYGILCDTDAAKLQLGQAEYEGTGHQGADELSYDVDFRGFKPNTTYYYRAYYKFNSSNHGNIVPKNGSTTDEVIYDTTVKSFTTGDNALTVDVVMCIDVTGSMSSIIYTVKQNAISFYDSFKECCNEEGIALTGLNAQVIAFRDKNVDYNWLETSPTYTLPEQKSDFDNFVNGLYADGGGDTPESGLEALEAAFNKTDWGADDGYHRQVVILWTDADYLANSEFTALTVEGLNAQWNAMPSGRRLILFAPYGTYDWNGGSWGNLDGWKNLIHEDDLWTGFNNFTYILKSIIGELTSKSREGRSQKNSSRDIFFRPNK